MRKRAYKGGVVVWPNGVCIGRPNVNVTFEGGDVHCPSIFNT